jgi:5'-3' exoribonuclease 1
VFLLVIITNEGWPYLKEALAVSVTDELFCYKPLKLKNRVDTERTPLDQEEVKKFLRSCEKIEESYDSKLATLIGPVSLLVQVRPLVGMDLLQDGSLVKRFSNSIIEVPVQLVLFDAEKYEDSRYKAVESPPTSLHFPLNSFCFLLATKYYGCMCKVAGHKSADTVDIHIQRYLDEGVQEEPNFNHVLGEYKGSNEYLPSWIAAKKLGINGIVLSKVTSSLHVQTNRGQRVNLGLNLKFESRALKVLGYSRKSQKGWEFSAAALNLVSEYRKLFPNVFAILSTNHQDAMYTEKQMFPDSKGLDAAQAWLKEQGVYDFCTVSLESDSLPKVFLFHIGVCTSD